MIMDGVMPREASKLTNGEPDIDHFLRFGVIPVREAVGVDAPYLFVRHIQPLIAECEKCYG